MARKNKNQRSMAKGKKRKKLFSLRKQSHSKNEKIGPDLIQDRIQQSFELANEPELLDLAFSPDLVQSRIVSFLDQRPDCVIEERTDVARDPEKLADLITYFSSTLLSDLLTGDFTCQMSRALRACETRMKMVGQKNKSEAALITRSLIDISDQETLQEHPLILRIAFMALDQAILERENRSYQLTFCGLLFELLDANEMMEDFVGGEQGFYTRYYDNSKSTTRAIEIDLASLPARALYKNFDPQKVYITLQENTDFCPVEDQEPTCHKFISDDPHLYLEVDQERLRLHASSMDSLDASMEAIEDLCGDQIFFLAKRLDQATNSYTERR